MTRIMGIFFACVTVPIFLAAQQPASGKDGVVDQLGKESLRLIRGVADEFESMTKTTDPAKRKDADARAAKLAAESAKLKAKIDKLSPEDRDALDEKYGDDIAAAQARVEKAVDKLGVKQSPDQLGKTGVRLTKEMADEMEAMTKTTDKEKRKASDDKLGKLAAQLKEVNGAIEKLPPEDRQEMVKKYKPDIDANQERMRQAAEKLGIPLPKEEPKVANKDEPKKESIEDIIKRLEENLEIAADRLKDNDPGKETVKIQDEIVKDLDELLKQNNPNGGGGGGGGSSNNSGGASGQSGGQSGNGQGGNGQSGSGQKGNGQNGGAGQKNEKNKDGNGGLGQGKDGSKSDGGSKGGTGKDADSKLGDLFKDVWGHLPKTKRQEMEAYSKERLVPSYEDILRQYYRTIAEQGRKE